MDTITIRITDEWLAKVDKWRNAQSVPPTRSDVIRIAVERFVSKAKEAKQ